jgi:hypothetical protein
MALVEQHLHEAFANIDDNAAPPIIPWTSAAGAAASEPEAAAQPPFARVNTVAEGSPAATAGLKPGDEIRTFGYVNSSNHDNLKRVGECVQGNEGVSFRGLATQRLSEEMLLTKCRTTSKTYLSEYRVQQTMCRGVKSSALHSRHGATGADEACWAVTLFLSPDLMLSEEHKLVPNVIGRAGWFRR